MSADAQHELCMLTALCIFMAFYSDPMVRCPWPSTFFQGHKVSFTSKLLCGWERSWVFQENSSIIVMVLKETKIVSFEQQIIPALSNNYCNENYWSSKVSDKLCTSGLFICFFGECSETDYHGVFCHILLERKQRMLFSLIRFNFTVLKEKTHEV